MIKARVILMDKEYKSEGHGERKHLGEGWRCEEGS